MREIQRKVDLLNRHSTRLQVIITGRELTIQSNTDEFRREKQIYSVLPYFLGENKNKEYEGDDSLINQDQRNQWWGSYGKASGRDYENLPIELQRTELVEITSQPLLNYLVALSYDRGELDFSRTSNLNDIYDDLLKAVYMRGWANHEHPAVRGVKENEFMRILEAIAIATWHGDGRKTTVKEIEEHCLSNGLKNKLDDFQEGASNGLTRLLTAFYFRQSGQSSNGEKTFEFTHKSFGEYLTSKRLINSIKKINRELERRKFDTDDGWNEKDALKYWLTICGPSDIDKYLYKFIEGEIFLHDINEVEVWQNTFSNLIEYVLVHGTPVDSLEVRRNHVVENSFARNAEAALLIILSICASRTGKNSDINWPTETTFGNWILKLRGQRKSYSDEIIVMDCLSRMSIKNAVVISNDLFKSNFRFSNLLGSSFSYCDLVSSNLSNCNLELTDFDNAFVFNSNIKDSNLSGSNLVETMMYNCDLSGSRLNDADMHAANFKDAKLINCDLTSSSMPDAIFDGAILDNSILMNANMYGSSFKRARFVCADLSDAICEEGNFKDAILERAILHRTFLARADLQNANMTNSNIVGSNLSNSNLSGANLSGAILTDTDLTGANLSGAILTDTDLTGANLSGAILTGTDLTCANLSGANLSNADLRGAILTGVDLTRTNLMNTNLA